MFPFKKAQVRAKNQPTTPISELPVEVPPAPKNAGKFHVFRSRVDDLWYFHLTSRNGQVMFASEGYMQKHMAIKTIKRIQEVAPNASIVIDE